MNFRFFHQRNFQHLLYKLNFQYHASKKNLSDGYLDQYLKNQTFLGLARKDSLHTRDRVRDHSNIDQIYDQAELVSNQL